MASLLAFSISIFLTASLLAEDELPKDPRESVDIEPPLLIQEDPGRESVQATGRKPQDGSIFGITQVTATESADTDPEQNVKLKIGVKIRPNKVIDDTKIKIQVFFYDMVDNTKVVLSAARVSYEWLTPHQDWKDTHPEVLVVTLRPKKRFKPPATVKSKTIKELATQDVRRKYLGYIVRIYYEGQLQAVRASPTNLLSLFPPPFTLPSK
jgi:hypothetical protein